MFPSLGKDPPRSSVVLAVVVVLLVVVVLVVVVLVVVVLVVVVLVRRTAKIYEVFSYFLFPIELRKKVCLS